MAGMPLQELLVFDRGLLVLAFLKIRVPGPELGKRRIGAVRVPELYFFQVGKDHVVVPAPEYPGEAALGLGQLLHCRVVELLVGEVLGNLCRSAIYHEKQ